MKFRASHASATSEPMPMDYARARLNMVNNQLRPNRVDDPNVRNAMAEIPRDRFLPKALRSVAYADEDLPLPDGSWLIEPLVLARLIQAAGVRRTDVVLVIGCSTGYAGVVLSRLAATVILVEPQATAQVVERLLDELGVDNAAVVVSDEPAAGDSGQAPFDIIFIVGSVASVPPALFEQIGETGRIVAVLDDGRIGKATLFTKLHGVIGQREMFDAQIPPCPGLVASPGFAF